MVCAACDLPTSELFGEFNNLCGTCDELGAYVPPVEDYYPEAYADCDEYDESDGYDFPEDIMCDLAWETEM